MKTCIAVSILLAFAIAPVRAADPVDLLPAENLQGWSRIPIPAISGVNPKIQWRVDTAAKTLICTGEGGHEWLRYDKELSDFVLEADWRFTPKDGETKYNSGIGIRLSKQGEIWYQAQTGLAGAYLFGQNFADGGLKSFNLKAQMKENRVKPAGEWNHFLIRAEGDRITLSVNGEVVNELTGVGMRRGYIGLEAEGYEITFRNLKLQTLP
ncbi:3-keto-disaccharide hydrolase [Paludibaculum fermentans]|uniref:DUF1080 domain-containing protein n=1 Tax=Paludibaculum fermentans TaxID=1473598 RepID=A0A7S7NRK1_PALFE|nr:DUF1080 domain-containing protein [Paludibaculum fermentans]QOY88502.1 DUF1080 domain-containing protein [Paludibaculum fermentans]